ncbi:hypothetical protein AWH56_008700 [Anaerobacillus isosaccharinicus]|uniref:Uncharacterized protein n=1 Tax=Anaerobacillus isosaccharinicus TaxID=1532552 RepID=A0A1S2L1D6_9BACI|nr:hypothetical protein [Anaerobacillus isosaccharinicus]MBA5588948.1 hypothetical protein [Anaerobacillus isosaccharinicus]QOY37643.1 hypothetical protein AWH56_008700 [Anaerobacillus isosaccharinicus]
MKKTLYGRVRGKNGEILLFTKWSNVLFTFLKVFLLVVLSPIWLPLYVLTYLGAWSETFLYWIDPKVDRLIAKIVPRNIGK